MKKVFKYQLRPGVTALELPIGFEILTVQLQGGEPQLWALVDQAQPSESVTILIVGTGHDVPNDASYIATFQVTSGTLIFHAFRLI